jgi:hypothetical protein
MESKTKICCNVKITINNQKHNILHYINQTEKDITIDTKCYQLNSDFGFGEEHAFYCINLKNEIEKGNHLPVYLENLYFKKTNFIIYIKYLKREDIEIIKHKIYNYFCKSFNLG